MEDAEQEPEAGELGEPGDLAQRDIGGPTGDDPFQELTPPPQPFYDIPSLDIEMEAEDDEGSDTGDHDSAEEAGDGKNEEDDPGIPRIAESLLERTNLVFVAPLQYEDSVQRQHEKILGGHIFIVHGEEHSGKLTCALQLAQYLLGRKGVEKRIYCYRRHLGESLSLLDLVQQKEIREECAYIIEDALPGVAKEDLEGPYIYSLNEKLRDKTSFFILTTEDPPGALPAGVAKVQVAVDDLERVFSNHLYLYETDKYATEGMRIEKSVLKHAKWEVFQEDLKDPDQIDEFCRRLGAHVGTPDAAELKKMAQEIALRRTETARPWFADLSLHEKLFAFLVVLFRGHDGRGLYEIFLEVVGRLRGQGISLVDPREIGYNDLLERVRVLEMPTREISFQERVIGSEVERQLKNYNFLLWSLVPWFLDEIQRSSGREAGEVRRGWAAAVGRIGLHHPRQLREKLKELARHPSNAVAAATGYAFSEVCLRDRDADQEVCNTLRDWVASRESRLLWAASSCIWRVYGTLKRSARDTSEPRARLLHTLEALAVRLEERQPFCEEDWKTAWAIASRDSRERRAVERQARDLLKLWVKKNRDSTIFAIEQLISVDPEAVIERLRQWLGDNRSALRSVALSAIRRLFESAARESGPPRLRHMALIGLIEVVLTHCGEGSKVTAALFKVLAKWVDQPVAAGAMATLFKTANRLTGRASRAFRTGLSSWLEDPSPEVRRVGGALMTRSLVLEGRIVPAPDGTRGALVLDASAEALGAESYELVARRIWNTLHPRFDLRLLRMGEERGLALAGERFPSRAVWGKASRPRLLLPAIEALIEERLDLLIVLAAGPILDFKEASMAVGPDRLLLVSSGEESPGEIPFPGVLRIDTHAPEGGLGSLAARLDDGFAAALARMGVGAPVTGDLEVRLEQWVQELDRPQSLGFPADRSLAILQAILGLAEADLERCSALLTRWLSPDRSDLERRMGIAAVRLLLRIEAYRSPSPDTAHGFLFDLARKLAGCGSEGLEISFSTIRRWLTLPEWDTTLRDGEPPALLEWIESLLPDSAEFLSKVVTEWRLSTEDQAEASWRVLETAERIERAIASRTVDPPEDPAPEVEAETVFRSESPAVLGYGRESLPSNVTDPTGFPLVWVEEIGAFMHWLPVTKIQFEKFIAATSDPRFNDAWYRLALELNPRVPVPEIGPSSYPHALMTGVLPQDAQRFAAWCGEEYSLPTLDEWQKAYAALAALEADAAALADLLEGAGDLVRLSLTRIEAASTAAVRPGRKRTRADQMLMRLGVLEWAGQAGGVSWVGMGEPSPYFRTMWSVEKGPAMATDPLASRSSVFGFRLIRRPA